MEQDLEVGEIAGFRRVSRFDALSFLVIFEFPMFTILCRHLVFAILCRPSAPQVHGSLQAQLCVVLRLQQAALPGALCDFDSQLPDPLDAPPTPPRLHAWGQRRYRGEHLSSA